MRVMLLALVAAMVMPLCERRNTDICDDEIGCGPGYACVREPGAQKGLCELQPDMRPTTCSTSMSCAPELPICDTAQSMCRACLPGEDARCRESNPSLPRCLGPRCVGCLPDQDSAQSKDCGGATPICDRESYTCRRCRYHSECRSGVCAKDDRSAMPPYGIPQGTCVPQEQVLYVDPRFACDDNIGKPFCTPAKAIAQMDVNHRYLVLQGKGMAGAFSDLTLGMTDAQKRIELYVIGPEADGPPDLLAAEPRVSIGDVPGKRGFRVMEGVRVTIEGLVIRKAMSGVECSGDRINPSTEVRIRRSILTDNQTGIYLSNNCYLELSESWVGKVPQRGTLAESPGNVLAMDIRDSDFDVVNTIFWDNGISGMTGTGGLRVLGAGTRTGGSTLVNVTFYGQVGRNGTGTGNANADMFCPLQLTGRLALVNSLLFFDARGGMGHIAANCGVTHQAVGADDMAFAGNGSVVFTTGQDPGFRDAARGNLRLRAGTSGPQQIVRTGGVTSTMVVGRTVRAPEVDLSGARRPTEGVAMGAYEPDKP
jgi:hypothetical protein